MHDAGQKRLTHLGHEGVAQMALSMFDMALHDALAREAGVPLYKLLGGTAQPLPTYNSCGLGLMAPQDAAREAKELVAEHGGFSHIKLRMGREHAADEIAAYKAVRSAVGPDVQISCDFNQGLASAHALETCRAIDGLGLAWIEEPIAYDDYDTQARLATKLATPIQVGENWWSWRVGKAAIEMGACDYVMPDLLRIGGVTGWMRLARVAEARAVPFSSHLSPDYSAHVLAATPTRHWLEFMDWGQDLMLRSAGPGEGLHHAARYARHRRRLERESNHAAPPESLRSGARCVEFQLPINGAGRCLPSRAGATRWLCRTGSCGCRARNTSSRRTCWRGAAAPAPPPANCRSYRDCNSSSFCF